MHLDRMKTLSFISALALSLAFGCSSKKNNDDDDVTGAGGGGFQVTGGASSVGGGGGAPATEVDPNYCNGLLQNAICEQTRVEADVRQVNMLLVIDISGSMNKKPTDTATQTKWDQMKLALSSTLKQQARFIDFGLELFPYSGDPSAPGLVVADDSPLEVTCKVPTGDDPNIAVAVGVAPGLDHVTADILPVLESSTPAGGTPTTKALEQAYSYFVFGEGKNFNGTKWVLLATDGGPNCNPEISCGADTCTQNLDCTCGSGCATTVNCCESTAKQNYGYLCLDNQAVVDQIAKMNAAGIKTFVVGVPGTEAYTSTLNSMAIAGGMPKANAPNGDSYYAVSAANSLQDLQDAFSEITTQLVKGCDIPLTESPRNKNQVIVAVDCLRVPQVPDNTPEQGGADGYWIDYDTYAPEPAHLRVTGTYCSQLQTEGATNLDVITGCSPIN